MIDHTVLETLLLSLIVTFIPLITGTSGTRIVNGVNATAGSLPHQVTLQRYYYAPYNRWYHTCGGSVIGDNVVLTAAHCVAGREQYIRDYRVIINDHNLNDYAGNEQPILIAKIVTHYGYISRTAYDGTFTPNDIAILILANGVVDKNTIISLATEDLGDFAGTICTISGWGLLDTNGPGASILQAVNMTVLSQEECAIYWRNQVQDGQICIYGGPNPSLGASSCSGDSGGPMVCDGVLAGVTSWGTPGCRLAGTGEFLPSVYTRVSYYQGWIQTVLGRVGPGRG